eukprot:1158230-Pelagomonas_calceolata.AAC.5
MPLLASRGSEGGQLPSHIDDQVSQKRFKPRPCVCSEQPTSVKEKEPYRFKDHMTHITKLRLRGTRQAERGVRSS